MARKATKAQIAAFKDPRNKELAPVREDTIAKIATGEVKIDSLDLGPHQRKIVARQAKALQKSAS